jgi:hypothetical protein
MSHLRALAKRQAQTRGLLMKNTQIFGCARPTTGLITSATFFLAAFILSNGKILLNHRYEE